MSDKQLTCLQVHNDYQIPGGETKTAIGIADLLESNGIKVIRYYKSNDSFKNNGKMSKIRVGFNAIYNRQTIKEIEDILSKYSVDFALVHNVMPLISNSLYKVLIDNEVPIIKYIQNYNLICLNGGLDHGEYCKKCKKSSLVGVSQKCYKDSLVYTFIKYVSKRQLDKKYLPYISAFMPNSAFVRDQHSAFGMDTSKMQVMYNYINTEIVDQEFDNYNSYYLYFGRIAKEKGIITVVRAFKELRPLKLVIMGSGEYERKVKEEIESFENIEFIGPKNGNELKQVIGHAKAVVVPSEWDDPLPRTVIEAYSFGSPVIGARRGGITEMLSPVSAFSFESGDEKQLIDSVKRFDSMSKSEYQQLREACLKECLNMYSQDKYIDRFFAALNLVGINGVERMSKSSSENENNH